MPTTRKTKEAVKRYGITNCLRAFIWNARHGEGPSSIAQQMPADDGYPSRIKTTQQADAAINAGRELAQGEWIKAKDLLDETYKARG